MTKKTQVAALLAALLAVLLAPAAGAQVTTATIVGTITDSSGAALTYFQPADPKDRIYYGDYVAVVLPQPTAANQDVTLRFEYSGERVVTKETLTQELPFLLKEGVNTSLACTLFAGGAISLGKAARLAGKAPADFMAELEGRGIEAVDYPADELESDLAALP